MPSVSVSGDKFKKMVDDQIAEANATLKRLFVDRGFDIVDTKEVAATIALSKVDMTDEENHRKEILYTLGDTQRADLVVFTVITRTWQKETDSLFAARKEGFATTKTWLLDVRGKKPYLAAQNYEGRSSSDQNSASRSQVRAVRIALEKSLEEFLQPYPLVKR